MKHRLDIALAAAVGAASMVPLSPILHAGFLNWDDDAVFTENGNLVGAGLVRWAFTTTHMDHYQPLSWLTWGAVAQIFGLEPHHFHALSLLTHALVVALIYLAAVRLMDRRGVPENRARIGAAIAALVFGVHPLRVEPVAWASAFPYLAALACALLATLAYETSRAWAAVAFFAVSLLFRPIAFGLPLVLMALDRFPRRERLGGGRTRSGAVPIHMVPFFALAIAAAGMEWLARRDTFDQIGAGSRATVALAAPFTYMWRTVAPIRLSPVDVLALDTATSPVTIAVALSGLLVISLLAWRAAGRWPGVLLAWTAYLLLVAPAVLAGPSGLQVTADRYAYLPSAALAVATGSGCAATTGRWRRATIAAAALAVIGCAVLMWNQTQYWHDSIALWSRAAALDPRNDVAMYNLGTALQAAGRGDEAAAAYQATLRLVPDHAPAQHNLQGLQAIARQREADRMAQSGKLAEAIPIYREVLALDPARSRARAALGAALVQSGEFAAGAAEIEAAAHQGVDDPNLINLLSYALVQLGRTAEAATVLRAAIAKYPSDANLAHNLALLTGQPER